MSRTENRTENRTSRPIAEPALVPEYSVELRRRKPGRPLSERNVYHQRRSLLAEYQSGGTARRHAQFGNGQRASRASAGGRQDGRYPSLGLQSGCEAWHQGGTLGSTPWRTPPFYTSSTNTGECTCCRAPPATCITSLTALGGFRRTPRLSRICDDTGARGLEYPRSLRRILNKCRNVPRSRRIYRDTLQALLCDEVSRPLAIRSPNTLRPCASTEAIAPKAVNPGSARNTTLKLRSWGSVILQPSSSQ
jgi:hypothetical protein